MMNKKGMTWEQIVLAIIAVVVVVLVIWWFRSGGDKAYGQVDDKLSGLGDCDNDNVANMFDKCICDPNYGEKLETGKKCGASDSTAKTNCPTQCS